MKENTGYDDEKWVWTYVDDEEEDEDEIDRSEETKMPMWTNGEIRVSVKDVCFYDKKCENTPEITKNPEPNTESSKPSKIPKKEAVTPTTKQEVPNPLEHLTLKDRMLRTPFVVYATIKDEGLGMLSWWS